MIFITIFCFIFSSDVLIVIGFLAMDGDCLSLRWNNHASTYKYMLNDLRKKVMAELCIFSLSSMLLTKYCLNS